VRDLGVEPVRSAFLPPVEAPFMGPHEVLPGQNRPLLVPYDRLRQIQPGLLEGSGVVLQVRVAAPNIEATSRLERGGGSAVPGTQLLVELIGRDEVVRKGTILRAHLAVRF